MLPVFDLYSDRFASINVERNSDKELIRVFFNLYRFMLKLRMSIRTRVADPHIYTMRHLKQCISSSIKYNKLGEDDYNEDCGLDYNELTEVFYFMKYYLAVNDISNADKYLLDDTVSSKDGKS